MVFDNRTSLPGAGRWWSNFPEATSQTWIGSSKLGLQAARDIPSGENAKSAAPERFPKISSDLGSSPDCHFHMKNFLVLGPVATAIVVPSGEIAREGPLSRWNFCWS